MSSRVDCIVVGSGASATSAAFPLVRAGRSVVMLDMGNVDTRYAPLVPAESFGQIRSSDRHQSRYFLGDDFEGVPLGKARVGTSLTPPRQFIQRDADKYTPVSTRNFIPYESLALGGLASGWGAVAVQFDDHDLAGFPIKYRDLAAHYESVSARVGISGAQDDLFPYYRVCSSLQPPLDLDENAQVMLARYETRRRGLNRAGFFLGRARLAVLSRDLGTRKGQRYFDMDYYTDSDRSVFRPAFAVEELRTFPGFHYLKPYLVERFRELPAGGGVEVQAFNTQTGRRETFTGRRLILAAGTMGTARIVLRSIDRYDTPVPILSNANAWVPFINLATLGRAVQDRRHSLTQLAVVYDPGQTGKCLIHAQTYSYRSLLLFKLVKESFLPVAQGLRVLRELVNSFVVVNVFHEDRPAPGKYCVLRRRTGNQRDVLEIHADIETETARRQSQMEKAFLRLFRKLGCWPIGRIDPGYGTSVHYGGPFPMAEEGRDLTVTPQCRLRGTQVVYLADGSVLPYIPAKALSLTLMANAERVGTHVCQDLS